MRCNARVVDRTMRRKGSGEPYATVKFIAVAWGIGGVKPWNDPKYVAENTYECGGAIQASVETVTEPEWGGSYAKLAISYKCEKCGSTFFRGLPAEYLIEPLLGELLTNHIAALPQEKE